MKVKVKVYDMSKYSAEAKKVAEVEYEIEKLEVIERSDEEVYNMGFDEVDEHGEYLVLTLKGGETSTFKNSHVDVFRA